MSGYDGPGRRPGTTWADGRSKLVSYAPDGTVFETEDELGDRAPSTDGPDAKVGLAVGARPAGVQGSTREAFTSDGGRRLVGLVLAALASLVVLDHSYAHGSVDQVLSEVRRHDGQRADAHARDAAYRLTGAGLSRSGASGPDPGGRHTLGLVLDEASAFDSSTCERDGAGSRRAGQSTPRHLDHDARSRLIEATLGDGTSVGYCYDTLGRRGDRRRTTSGVSTTSRSVHDGWDLVRERTCASACSDAASYVSAREHIPSAVLDQPLDLIGHPPTGPPEGRRFLLFGGLTGSVALVRDEQGRPVERIRYLPQGQPTFDRPVTLRTISSHGGGTISVELRHAVDPGTVSDQTVQLTAVASGAQVPATVSPVSDGQTITLSGATLVAGISYRLTLGSGLTDAWGGTNGAPVTAEFAYQPAAELYRAPEYLLGLGRQTGLSRLWQGLEWDPVAGLHYVRNRWYDPETGSYLTAAPLGFPDGPSQFSRPRANGWGQDPWGLARKTENGGTNYLGNLGDVVDVEGPVSEALSIGLDYVGNNVSDFLNLDYIVGQVMVAGDSTRSGGEQAAAAGKAVAVTALDAAGGEILGGGAKVLGKVPLVRKIAGSRLGQAIGRALTKDLGALFRKEATAGADAVAAEAGAGAVRVGEGQISWTAPNGRVFDSEEAYVAAMRHRRASMAAASRGRNAHRADEIRRAGFEPSDVRLSEGGRNVVPEAVEDLAGNPHHFELKTSGYYSASFQNNIYPSVIFAGRRGTPFTLELRGTARMSRPLERLIRKVQERFGGSIIKGP